MKNKVVFPVLLIVWTTGFLLIGEMLAEFYKLPKAASLGEAVSVSYTNTLYRLIGILLIGTMVLYLVLSKILKKIEDPIKQLTKDAKQFAKGQYNYQLRNFDIDELQKLANAFDDMGDELNGTIRKLRHQKTKVESVLAALNEGIIVIDKEGQITEINDLASSMLNLKTPNYYQKSIVDIIRAEKFQKLIRDAFEEAQYNETELILGERIIYTMLVPVGSGHKVYEYLIVLRDVTQIRTLEEMKYQFVSNVSHELKTPLTSIQGFVETLKAGAIEDSNVALKFLDIIDVEAKRLYRLIQDILMLSEIENMQKQEYGNANITVIIQQVMDILKEEADKKEIEMIFDKQQDIILENTSEDHMKQVMINLISNAVKYTDRGQVIITAEVKEHANIISVKDTGIGIPKESIPHVFERFYRVDKGRSRKSGGTGLGLSIVKHIAQLYRAKIDVESEVGKGTKFTLKFKRL